MLLFVNAAPGVGNVSETTHALQFGQRSRQITRGTITKSGCQSSTPSKSSATAGPPPQAGFVTPSRHSSACSSLGPSQPQRRLSLAESTSSSADLLASSSTTTIGGIPDSCGATTASRGPSVRTPATTGKIPRPRAPSNARPPAKRPPRFGFQG